MQPATLNALECPGCRGRYRAVAHVSDGERIVQGYLSCDCQAPVIPIVEGFVLFTEPLLHAGLADLASLCELSNRLFGSAQNLEALYAQKRSRGVLESYAAFQPFNESSRAIEPLLPWLLADLRDGDLVLDIWCRTGWSAEWLAGRLATQHVVAMWDGDFSVLGYRGFRHLLGIERRAPNLDVIFANADSALPFGSDSFALLYGHDVLHRKSLHPFGAECLRVTRKSGGLVFPHVHLSNSEPEPFFERGGTIRHGRAYRAWLDGITQKTARRGLVCSEKTLFQSEERGIAVDEWDTTHYNALIAILPAAAHSVETASQPQQERFVVSPLFHVDLARATAKVDQHSLGGGCADLMLRHPVYRDCLPDQAIRIEGSKLLALVLAAAGLDAGTIVQSISAEDGISAKDDCFELNPAALALRELVASELLHSAPVGAGAHRLQRYHSNQLGSLDDAVWPIWLRHLSSGSEPMLSLPDGTTVSPPEVAEFMLRFVAWLQIEQILPGDWISVSPARQPLLWLAAVAAPMSGVSVEINERFTSHAGHYRVWLHDDDVTGEAPCSSIPLERGAESLLARLSEGSELGDAARVPPHTDGQVRFAVEGYRAVCRMQDFCRGCLALQGQAGQRTLMLEADNPLKNLACLVMALATAGRIL